MVNIYRIRQSTKAIISKTGSKTTKTYIYEDINKVPSPYSLQEILNKNCLEHGSSLEGRLNYAEHILRTSVKLPIIIHPGKRIFMIPTRSLSSAKSGVISYYQIQDYVATNKGTNILFHDGTRLEIDVSETSFNMQYKKTSQLIASLFRPTSV